MSIVQRSVKQKWARKQNSIEEATMVVVQFTAPLYEEADLIQEAYCVM